MARHQFVDQHTTLDGTQACVLGCTTRGQHQAGCPCHTACPDHDDHCTGCAPRPTRDQSLLCGSCFYRKLRSPLRRVPALHDWLTSRKGGLKAATYDGDRVQSSKEAPLPFNAAIVDHLSLTALLMNAWAHRGAEQIGDTPDTWGSVTSAAWLDHHASWVAEQPWVPLLIAHLRELEQRARALAPWQPTRHALPVPCFRCEHQTLVLFGGEDWVTCTSPDCDAVFGWSRYAALSKALGSIYGSPPGRSYDEEAG